MIKPTNNRTSYLTRAAVAWTLLLGLWSCAGAQQPWSIRMAEAVVREHPDSVAYASDPKSGQWNYEQGVVLYALQQVGQASHDPRFDAYVKRDIDRLIGPDGHIRTYEFDTFNLDNLATGRTLFRLFDQTGDMRYRTAADTLRKQLAQHPRTDEGGFWHKKIYPYQMWLDGLYMAEPFYAEYAVRSNALSDLRDVTHQFILSEQRTRDTATGLLYHAWDSRRQQPWANKTTGRSAVFWGRAMGWYAWALVDVLDILPADHPDRPELIGILQRLAAAIVRYRDTSTGLWYQVVNQGGRDGNYLESSASGMFVYVLAKGARNGYLDRADWKIAQRSFQSMVSVFVGSDSSGALQLRGTSHGAGLGGTPYRDGSYDYYIHIPRRVNDFRGVGPFIMAALELERPVPWDAKESGK